ncbi:MAG: bifunctional enoyl-CoA hydratase/phosphate acetyltransferase [Acidobacteriales bacterium]|nr:bifunctional enoyl-CoA hydratase/phosphate acetyltransferase [Terriglobales bacterium]
MDRIENRTFDELQVGDTVSVARTLTHKDIELFAVMSGDVNPAHLDEEYAKSDMFHKIIAHGMWGGAMFSMVMGTQLPGPGGIYLGQSLRFRRPVGLGDTITFSVKVLEKIAEKSRLVLDCQAINQNGELVMSGTAEVIAPNEKISRERVMLPEVKLLEKGRHYRRLIEQARKFPPVRTAIVHPVDSQSLLAAIAAAQAQLIEPVLVGPAAKIRAAAEQAQVDISHYDLIPTEHSHAAAECAVALAREKRVGALMRGSISTEELMRFVDSPMSLRTGRAISHVFAMDVPSFPRPLLLTDAVLNTAPTLELKRDIVQNAIDLALTLGIETPRVAILSAQERVVAKLSSTLDAAVLCKMADRGQITGGILDGPLAFDAAISEQAARMKGVESPVAGKADIFVVPNLEAGNIFIKELLYFADAQVAGLVIGARVPVVLVSRTDDQLACLGSCALALLLSQPRGDEAKAGNRELEALVGTV